MVVVVVVNCRIRDMDTGMVVVVVVVACCFSGSCGLLDVSDVCVKGTRYVYDRQYGKRKETNG